MQTTMATTIRAHIYVWGAEFCQVSIFAKLVCQTVGGHFFVLPKLNRCQIGLPNCWSCLNGKDGEMPPLKCNVMVKIEVVAKPEG
jgi:hypothetical protein